MAVSRDKSRAIAGFYQKLNKVNGSWERLHLAGLDPDKYYEVRFNVEASPDVPAEVLAFYGLHKSADAVKTFRMHGNTLMYAGIPISREILTCKGGDFSSLLFEIQEVK
jgi:alpha-galactosidase